MAMKHCAKIQVSLISHKEGNVSIRYFILSTPLGSTITQRKVIESSCPKNMHMCKWQWSIVQNHIVGELSTSYFTTCTHMDPAQFRILPFWLYEHLQMTIKYWIKFQVSPIGHLGKGVSKSSFAPSTPLRSTITHNWNLLSWQCTHLQMKMTLHKVSSIHSSIYKGKWTQDILHLPSPWIHHNSYKINGSSCPDKIHIY
jgi:hypothetical protein